MPDPRFYETRPAVTLGELASLTGARLADGGRAGHSVAAVAVLARADARSISFCADASHVEALAATSAAACFVAEAQADHVPRTCAALITAAPHVGFAVAAELLHRPLRHLARAPAIHPSAVLEEGVIVANGAVIGQGAKIGRGTYVAPGAVIGPGVSIGRDGFVGSGACVGFALVGDRVRIWAGAVIGEPGFGAAVGPRGVVDVPQLGRVIVQDGVTIGANSCIDRGAFDDTVIGENTKIDNMVQIAHNVVIGRNCLLVAFTGVSGSTTIGDGCVFGGRAGIVDHVAIGAGARIGASAGVTKDVPPGESWGGWPARPLKRWLRETAWLARQAARRPGGDHQS